MTDSELVSFLKDHPAFENIILPESKAEDQERGVVFEIAVVILLLPFLRLVLKKVGLPWIVPAETFSTMASQKLDAFIREKLTKDSDIDPLALQLTGRKIIKKLNKDLSKEERKSLEAFLEYGKESKLGKND